MTTTIVMSAYEISGLSHPSYPSAAARKKYIDDISGNCIWRFPGSSTAITKFLASSAFKRNNWNSNAWKNSGLIWNSDLSSWTAKPSGSAGGITKLSELTIDADKDWNNKAIYNFSYLSGSVDSSSSPNGLWLKDEDSGVVSYFSIYGGLFRIGSNYGGVYNRHITLGGDGANLPYVGINVASPGHTLHVSGTTYLSGTTLLKGNTISGLSTPLWPSSATNKKYVDDREVNIEAQIAALSIEDMTDVAIMTPAEGRVLTWKAGQNAWSSQTAQGGVTYISSCTDASISGWTSGQVLTWNGSDWSNKYPALTFSVANVRLSANTYLNLTQFNTGAGKSCYVLQASCCNSSCASISGIRVQVLDDNSVIYETSSSTIRQGGPLAKSNAASQMKIRFMYSGSHSRFSGYKYGNAFAQVVVY